MSMTSNHTRTATSVPTIDPQGAVRITRHVLATIVELAALGVEGVARLAPISSPWSRLFWRMEPQRGLALNVRGAAVAVDIYLILKPGVNMASVGRSVQDAVTSAIEHMLGMSVSEVNVYIQDIAQDVA
jgi:uncharacterized alkaline shock family protein YloU